MVYEKSLMWDFFTRVDREDKLASCNYCDNDYSYRTTITNLKSHLKGRHPEAFRKYQEKYRQSTTVRGEINACSDLDDDSEGSAVAGSDLWSFFEKLTGGRARCVVCRSSVASKAEELKAHLREQHPKLDPDGMTSEVEADNENAEDNFTEVIYLEEPQAGPKPDGLSPLLAQLKNESKETKRKRKTYHKEKRRKISCSSEDTPKKERIDEELEKFGTYVTCLLKSVPHTVCTKLQMDIINIIMKAKLDTKKDQVELLSNDSFVSVINLDHFCPNDKKVVQNVVESQASVPTDDQ